MIKYLDGLLDQSQGRPDWQKKLSGQQRQKADLLLNRAFNMRTADTIAAWEEFAAEHGAPGEDQ